jgi:putative ABC transport system permease protein
VLKTLGFGDKTVLFLVLAESMVIAAVGGALGVGTAKLFTMGGDPTGGMLPVFYLSTGEMLLGLGIAIFVGLAAGSIPALTAMNLRIVDALRRV